MGDECNCAVVWTFCGIALLWDWNENRPFHSCGHCWVFQICYHIECSTLTASSFRIWNSSIGIPSPPLAFFVVMLPKAHLTLDSRMSGSKWVITPSGLSGLWRSFLYSSSVYSCYLFLISSASVRSTLFLSFIVPIFAWNVPLVSLIFLKRSLVFSHSVVFLYFFVSITEEGFLISSCYSLELCIQSFSPLPLTSLLLSAICKASLDNHFAFLHLFFLGMVLITASCTMSQTYVHSSSGTLSIKSNPLNLFVTSTV